MKFTNALSDNYILRTFDMNLSWKSPIAIYLIHTQSIFIKVLLKFVKCQGIAQQSKIIILSSVIYYCSVH